MSDNDYDRLSDYDALKDCDSLDPECGGVRPGESFSLDRLPLLDPVYKRRRIFSIRFEKSEGNQIERSDSLSAKQGRVFLEQEMQRLLVLKRGRVHGPKDCYFVIKGKDDAR